MRQCSVADCLKKATKRGWCGAHYFRWRMHGSPTAGRSPWGERKAFLLAFDPPPTEQCIPWPFKGSGHGYGSKIDGLGYPHRFICKTFHGDQPSPRHEVAHGCGNSLCINPAHLRWALHVENVADMIAHGRGWWQRGASDAAC